MKIVGRYARQIFSQSIPISNIISHAPDKRDIYLAACYEGGAEIVHPLAAISTLAPLFSGARATRNFPSIHGNFSSRRSNLSLFPPTRRSGKLPLCSGFVFFLYCRRLRYILRRFLSSDLRKTLCSHEEMRTTAIFKGEFLEFGNVVSCNDKVTRTTMTMIIVFNIMTIIIILDINNKLIIILSATFITSKSTI